MGKVKIIFKTVDEIASLKKPNKILYFDDHGEVCKILWDGMAGEVITEGMLKIIKEGHITIDEDCVHKGYFEYDRYEFDSCVIRRIEPIEEEMKEVFIMTFDIVPDKSMCCTKCYFYRNENCPGTAVCKFGYLKRN